MPEIFDVAIVGASLAGSAAAHVLGSAGLRVILLDKATFPRRKPCGEGLSSFGLKQLERLGLAGQVLASPHTTYSGYRVTADTVTSVMNSPWGSGITIQRSLLDNILFNAASSHSSVITRDGASVKRVSRGELVVGGSERIRCRHLVIADGANSRCAEQLECAKRRYGPPRNGITATFNGRFLELPKCIDIILKRGYEIYCTPLSEERLNISILAKFNSELNIRSALMHSDTLHEAFTRSGFNGELELEPMGRTQIGNVRRTCKSDRVHLVGDAKEEFDPIGGMGMSHALKSGIEAAEGIIDSLTESRFSRFRKQNYAAPMRHFTTLCYHALTTAERYPFLLGAATSPVARKIVRSFTRELS